MRITGLWSLTDARTVDTGNPSSRGTFQKAESHMRLRVEHGHHSTRGSRLPSSVSAGSQHAP